MQIATYLDQVRAKYASGQATEHSYRPALQALFESIDPAVNVINEPKKSDAGMPDFLFERNGVPLGWAEAKDVNKDVIQLKGYSIEQRKRYEKAFPNLLYTNGVDFEFIRDGARLIFLICTETQQKAKILRMEQKTQIYLIFNWELASAYLSKVQTKRKVAREALTIRLNQPSYITPNCGARAPQRAICFFDLMFPIVHGQSCSQRHLTTFLSQRTSVLRQHTTQVSPSLH